jgi:N-methylhydantoinase A/oxoprolinase/acetone carboxylase beta subunit
MDLVLGLDVGGTTTDAVLYAPRDDVLVAAAKAPTSSWDYSEGIIESLRQLSRRELERVKLVALSTTLATNAVLENQGGPVGLLLIGYDPVSLVDSDLARRWPVVEARAIRGGHDCKGVPQAELDVAAVRQAVSEMHNRVEAFAVSGFFSVMNPEHERTAREVIAEMTSLPVVCGHTLSSRLDAVRRVTTAVLNARLLPIVRQLFKEVAAALSGVGLTVPLMIVKGDGSLTPERLARQSPVEVILSGPAASAIGASFLSGELNAVVLDIGGTSTDIVTLENGRPWINASGAGVGGWSTSIASVDARTIALGGDSLLRVTSGPGFRLGPERAIPLCKLAQSWPELLPEIESTRSVLTTLADPGPPEYWVSAAPSNRPGVNDAERERMARLGARPERARRDDGEGWEHVQELGIVRISGLTPSDLFWSAGIGGSQLAAEAASQAFAVALGWTLDALRTAVQSRICITAGEAVFDKLSAELNGKTTFPIPAGWSPVVEHAGKGQGAPGPECQRHANLPIVAIGAPAPVFGPPIADWLHTRCIVPRNHEVGNAVGAAVAGVSKTVEVFVQPFVEGGGTVHYLVHSSQGRKQFASLSKAIVEAETDAAELARESVYQMGGRDVHVRVDRREVQLGATTEVTVRAYAVGQPRLATRGQSGQRVFHED